MARIFSGLIVIAMLAWFLWPRGSALLDREEALFAFLIALGVWIMTEVKESDEVIYRAATKNDIRLARELVSYASDKLKHVLKDHDFHSSIEKRYLSEVFAFDHEYKIGIVFFQDKRVAPLLDDFCRELEIFAQYITQHSVSDDFGRASIVPFELMGERERFEIEIVEANRLANNAWNKILPLIGKIKERIPEAFDEPISYDWFRSTI